jgi:hypothetical protein
MDLVPTARSSFHYYGLYIMLTGRYDLFYDDLSVY